MRPRIWNWWSERTVRPRAALAFTATWPAVVDGTLAKPAPRSLIVLNSGFESHSTRYFSTLWPPDSTGGAQATPRFVRDTENSLTRVGAEGSRYAGLMA